MGMSTAAVQVTTFAMLTSLYPDEVSKYIAKVELALGVGLVIGPLIATLLYDLGGFYLPFLVFVVVFLLEFVGGIIYLPGRRLSSKSKMKKE